MECGGYVVNIDRSRLEGALVYTTEWDMWAGANYALPANSYYGI
jgi:hypothetical protein